MDIFIFWHSIEPGEPGHEYVGKVSVTVDCDVSAENIIRKA